MFMQICKIADMYEYLFSFLVLGNTLPLLPKNRFIILSHQRLNDSQIGKVI